MATKTFEWVVSTQATPTIGYVVRTAQFGDGYAQDVGEGVNNKTESWEVNFIGSDVDVLAIMDFLDSLGGYRSFFWTNPLGQLGLYKCKDPSPVEMGGNTYSFSGTFTKAYAA